MGEAGNARRDQRPEPLASQDLAREQASDLPEREVLTIIDNPIIGGSITAGPTAESTSGTSLLTGDSTTGTTGTTDTTTSPAAGATQLGTQGAADGTTLAQDQTTAAASSDDGTYSPQETSASQT